MTNHGITLPEVRFGLGLCVLRGDMWTVGGRDNNVNQLRSCERLDVAAHTWVRGPDMATERSHAGVGVLNGEIWIIGGWDSSGGPEGLSSCERLDAVTGTWIPGPDTTKPHVNHCVVVLHNELWVVASDCRSTERLDAATDRWVCEPLKIRRRQHFAAAVFREQLSVVGGRTKVRPYEQEVVRVLRCCIQHMDGRAPLEHRPFLAQPCCARWGAVGHRR